ncbi:Holliday junction resolvase RecU [Vagococcus lutrae]|uniref:Holliday junction resolvase RecU n=1 Tax=Vagococcus lutrae TaxID=81947 RepID=UPI0020103135|nr:Holliday junction resolvase RecU [Vagococcus lutrae]MDT2806326.1 Holliday junction resolvase RecU [Vagococcus lutrae]MDT2824578.1 Holliday junction resolvase RecU [Vagococcus lutrae]MDT2842293.1 Holliday junction resolvase RecU [Vagococcus lutrae]UQF19215.1 Holliday junction resolvase RecU [Vagococcus lutrae]
MTIKYPNGYLHHHHKGNQRLRQPIQHGNRGQRLESLINDSNTYYLTREIAVIHKKPTPVQIVNVDYPKRSAAIIKEAYFKQPSTTDFNGIYKGRYLDFEAKETKNKTSFPLSNFHDHQINHMKACHKQAGITFVLINFSSLNRYFFLPGQVLFDFWDSQHDNGRKSIPLKAIEAEGIELSLSYQPRLDYLKAVDQYI